MARTASRQPKTPAGGAADRLRDEIDRGGTGDKIAFTDPAAAPLGTDDEAAGTPPTAEQVAEAARHESARDRPGPKPTIGDLQAGGFRRLVAVAICLGIAVAAALWIGAQF